MRLLAISDLHLGYRVNREALSALPEYPDDWLLVGGDLGESMETILDGLTELTRRFPKVFWTPGNHELWTVEGGLRGVAKYHALVDACRALGVVTPEDPYVVFPGERPRLICPAFQLYDYSFGPPGLDHAAVVAWAAEQSIVAMDERLVHPDPYPTRQAWCAARVAWTEARFAATPGLPLIVMTHWPILQQLVRIPRVPRYAPWCGTVRTASWPSRFPIEVAVNGHLHVRATDWVDGVRFEEVALGYPRHWRQEAGMAHYLREILPGDGLTPGPTRWWR